MKIPEGWQKADRPWAEYPIGTKARQSWEGGYWIKTEQGWKWHNGSTFPRPGAADQVMLAAAPTPPAPAQEWQPAGAHLRCKRCGENQEIKFEYALLTDIPDAVLLLALAEDVADMAPEVRNQLRAIAAKLKSPPAQEDEPVAWMYTRRENTSDSQAEGVWFDYTSIHQNKEFAERSTGHIPLYTHPDNGELRKAAEELLHVLNEGGNRAQAMQNLRVELEKFK